MNFIDSFLNKITMYRLVLYYLIALLLIACVFGLFGVFSYSPLAILFSAIVITAVCWMANEAFAYFFDAHPNTESAYITALILALIMMPVLPSDVPGVIAIIAASILAMASKYVLAINKKHIFNPAAIAAVLTGIAMGAYASWWVGGNIPLLAFVLLGGLLIVRKLQRFDLVLSFAAAALVMTSLTTHESAWWLPGWQTLLHSPFFFFAFVMLTEPATTPPKRSMRVAYGALTGILFAPAVHVASIYSTPEIALSLGNIFSYVVSPKQRLTLTLDRVEKTSASSMDFVFTADQPLPFKPGQYLEWTLPHAKPDSRGNRRYFTIAASPTEQEIRLAVKFYEKPSSFKRALANMQPGDRMSAAQLSGEFTLPENAKQKVAFIAGGIGITPFRSMLRYMIDTKSDRSAVLLYANRTVDDIAYRDICEEARTKVGIKTIYALDNPPARSPDTYAQRIDTALIRKEIPDYAERTFYLSGPRSMVVAFEKQLSELGVPRQHILTDFFPGFA